MLEQQVLPSPRLGSESAAVAGVAMVVMALLILAAVMLIPVAGGSAAADMPARLAKLNAAFATLPQWVQQWMSFQHFIFAGSLLFFVWHLEARVYLGAIVLSHAISFAAIAAAPMERLGLGLVSLNHLVWIPALVYLLRRWPRLEWRNPYGLWLALATFQMGFSLVFDIRDSAPYISTVLFL